MRASTGWLVLFVGIGVAECAAEAVHAMEVAFVTKATLMPLLLAWAWGALPAGERLARRRLSVALAGSWVGDVALMLAPASAEDRSVLGLPKHELWFLVGVAGFFVAHLAFISLYRRVERPEVPGPWPVRWWIFVPLVAFGLAAAVVVLPSVLAVPEKRIALVPLTAYATLLVGMVGAAMQRLGRVGERSFWMVAVGAWTFLVSDTLIGVNHLMPGEPWPLAGLAIMSTYLLAEALIVGGLVAQGRFEGADPA